MKRSMGPYFLVISMLFASVTYAAGGKSLWGDIDEKETPSSVTIQPEDINAPPLPKAVAPTEDTTLKSTCDLIRAQKTLDPNVMKTPLVVDALRNNMQLMAVQYKAVLNSPEALNNLYILYRDQYLRTYCG